MACNCGSVVCEDTSPKTGVSAGTTLNAIFGAPKDTHVVAVADRSYRFVADDVGLSSNHTLAVVRAGKVIAEFQIWDYWRAL